MNPTGFAPPESYSRLRDLGLLGQSFRLWDLDWLTDQERLTWSFPDYTQPTLSGLAPFARDYTGDPYCWRVNEVTAFGEPPIVLCDHEDVFAWHFAPSVAGAIFRSALTFAAAARQECVEPMVEMIHRVVALYGFMFPNTWTQRLLELASNAPKVFRGASITKYALHAPWDCEREIKKFFGNDYITKSLQWANVA